VASIICHLQLLVQIQNKDQIISNLSTENDNLTTALASAEIRVNELYTDQSRMEDEMATRMEVTEKLRSQVRELEKEKRDIQRRYNEQVGILTPSPLLHFDRCSHML
jgi:peptidoglycan hydrolase CwlO-like protein